MKLSVRIPGACAVVLLGAAASSQAATPIACNALLNQTIEGATITIEWDETTDHPGHYRISFDDAVFADFAVVQAASAQVGADVVITKDASNNITLKNVLLASSLVLGIGTFLFAMRWDASDPTRETRRSDVAFWLHLLAAPLIVHPVFELLGLTRGAATTLDAVLVIGLYIGLGLVALAIDRRALLVSALAYVLFALNSLFQTYGAVELSVALTALVIGSALLLLSAFWASARRAVVTPLPNGLRGKLPVLDRTKVAAAA